MSRRCSEHSTPSPQADRIGGDSKEHKEGHAAAASLLKLRDRVSGEEPLALGVITGSGFALSRRDGVLQIPIGSLAA